ncbi:MAG: type 1 glutamine amidotransferase domain-containing protein [Bacteroidota bacterium]
MELQNKKIVTLIHDMYEDLELWYPVIRLKEAGAEVLLAGDKAGTEVTGKHGLPARADIGFEDMKPTDFDALIIPGGYAPDKLRRDSYVTAFAKQMNDAEKPIGIICHAGWVLVSAGILDGKKATSYISIKDDMVNAGVDWVDEEVVVDGNLISSRSPHDLHVYVKKLIEVIKG